MTLRGNSWNPCFIFKHPTSVNEPCPRSQFSQVFSEPPRTPSYRLPVLYRHTGLPETPRGSSKEAKETTLRRHLPTQPYFSYDHLGSLDRSRLSTTVTPHSRIPLCALAPASLSFGIPSPVLP